MVISRLGGGEIVGILSVIVGLSSLVGGIINLGVNVGLSRFTGYCLGRRDDGKKCASEYLWTASLFSMIVYGIGSASILAVGYLFPGIYGYSRSMMLFAAIFNFIGFLGSFSSFLQSALRTRMFFNSVVISITVKFVLGIALFKLGYGWKGVAVGYMMNSLLQGALNAFQSVKVIGFNPSFSVEKLRDLLRAGVPSWAPGLISTLGQWLGVLILYGSTGSLETGSYYIASQLANVVLMISNTMNGLLLPVLSGLEDGRKRVGARVFRLSLALMMPIGVYVMFYPNLFLSFFGESLSSGWLPLVILLSSSPLVAYSSFVTSLFYAYGMYRVIFLSGIFANVPRVILYFLLTSRYGGGGVAASVVIGTAIGTAYLYFRARREGIFVSRRVTLLTLAIPYSLGTLCFLSHLNWAAAMLILGASYIIYIKAKIITLEDIREIGRALFGRERASLLYLRLRPILEPLFE